MADPVRGPVDLLARVIEFSVARVGGVARLGGDFLLAALLAGLGRPDQADAAGPDGRADADEPAPEELIIRGILAGEGRYTRLEVVEQAGVALGEARRLWRALGFPEVDDDQRIFTTADVAALTTAHRLIAADIIDADSLVELARPLGNLMSRIAAAQTTFISEVLGARLASGLAADDPRLPDVLAEEALAATRELLPVLELTTTYAWRRHLAAEVGRALISGGLGVDGDAESRTAVVGFVDLTGYTRLSRSVDLADLAGLLDRFETVVLDVVVEHGGRVIKNLGDEILFVIEDPVAAAEAALRLVDLADADDTLPPMHAGLAFGTVLDRGGDVYGPVVNTAARLSSLARRGTVRVDAALAAELADAGQFALSTRTPRHVRGYLQLPSYRLRRARNR